LGEAQFTPVFEELDRRNAVVHIHPAESFEPRPLKQLPAATLDFPFDTTRAVTSLLFNGVFSQFRGIRFIFSHAGGTVPFLAERIARLERRPEFNQHVPNGAIAELKRLYFDMALSANRYAFSALLELVGPEQILFASDYPFAPEDTMNATVKGLLSLGLSESDLRAIEHENVLALMPGLAPAQQTN
jgi:predicted TIM-barrel fold metal-dependent hydrolase